MTDLLLKQDFDVIKKLKNGNGGTSYLIFNGQDLYVYKPDDFVQGINEYVAQKFIKCIGLHSLDAKWMQYGELISCVTKYKQNLVRIKSDYFSYLSEKQKVEWFAFRILNKVFDNPDKFGEQYLDENSNIYSLDFGESIITSTQNARMVIKNILVDSYHEIIIDNYCEEKFYERLYECRHECHELLNAFDIKNDNVDDYFEKALNMIKRTNVDEMSDVFDEISDLFSKELADIYKEILQIVVTLCDFKR